MKLNIGSTALAAWRDWRLFLLSPMGLSALAAPDRQPQPPVPERTTSVFGDWAMSFAQRADATRPCEPSLTIQDQKRQIGMVLAFGRPAKGMPLLVVLQVPANIRTTDPALLDLDGAPATVAFNQCNRLGCFAQLELKGDSLIRHLRGHRCSERYR